MREIPEYHAMQLLFLKQRISNPTMTAPTERLGNKHQRPLANPEGKISLWSSVGQIFTHLNAFFPIIRDLVDIHEVIHPSCCQPLFFHLFHFHLSICIWNSSASSYVSSSTSISSCHMCPFRLSPSTGALGNRPQ